MSFLRPQVRRMEVWQVETTHGTEIVPKDLAGDKDAVAQYCEGKVLERQEIESVHGWFGRLSAAGYTDCTGWSGPFRSNVATLEYLIEMYGEEVGGASAEP